MALVSIDPAASNRPYLLGGTYGPNLQHDADCEITEYEFPALEPPRFAPEDSPNNWAKMQIKVRVTGGITTVLFVDINIEANSGCRLGEWLTAIGIDCDGEGFTHDPDTVPGTKCAVEIGDPRPAKNDPNRMYSGRVRNLYGV